MFIDETWTVGNIVKTLREEQGISLMQLSNGICSVTTLSRFEFGGRELDFMMLIMIFKRLGYNPDKYELYASREEIKLYEKQETIRKWKKMREWGKMEEECEEYSRMAGNAPSPFDMQFLACMQGYLKLQKGAYKEGVSLLEQAAAITIPEWNSAWSSQTIMGEGELECLCGLADAYEADDAWKQAAKMRENVLNFLEWKKGAKDYFIETYTEAICKLAQFLLKEEKVKKGVTLCEQGVKALSKTNSLNHWPELLYWKGRCLERLMTEGKAEVQEVTAVFERAYYVFRLMKRGDMAESVRSHMEEVYGWEFT